MKTNKAKRTQKLKKINAHRERLLENKPRKDKRTIQGNYDLSRKRKKLHGEKESRSAGEMQIQGIKKYYK